MGTRESYSPIWFTNHVYPLLALTGTHGTEADNFSGQLLTLNTWGFPFSGRTTDNQSHSTLDRVGRTKRASSRLSVARTAGPFETRFWYRWVLDRFVDVFLV